MKTKFRHFLALSITGLACLQAAQAQTYAVPDTPQNMVPRQAFSQQELDAMLAPIALYPDALLTQILMAATYPLEVVEAARYSRTIPGMDPQQAVRSAAQRNWDPSVQSLMAFPQILDMMDRSLDWTQRLGDAFLSQQEQVWGTVQDLRQRAYAAGQLRSTEQIRVLHNGPIIMLEPMQPDVIYVPYYDPLRVYGRWWWPGYAPMRWDPWPGYYRGSPGVSGGFYVGSGIQIGLGFFFGQIDWHTNRARVQAPPVWRDRNDHDRPWQPGRNWEHDPQHRGNVPYGSPLVRQRPAPTTQTGPNREFRGHMPNPAVRVAPVAPTSPAVGTPAPRRPAERENRRAPERLRPGAAPVAPGNVAPAAPAPRPDAARGPAHRAEPAAQPRTEPPHNAVPRSESRPPPRERDAAEPDKPSREPISRRGEERP